MSKIRVMLCCGAGMSSGFLAQRVRAEAKKQKVDLQIDARSENQVPQYYGKFDILLLGPHFKSQLPNYQKISGDHGFKVDVIPQSIYGALDARKLMDMINKMAAE